MKLPYGLILISLLWTGCTTEITKINFGSNDGRHIIINNRKIYFEEYGQGTPLLLLSGGGINRSIRDFENVSPTFQNIIELLHLIRQDKVGLNKLTV
jgi:hypothetical protein